MAVLGSYKSQQRQQRVVDVEESFFGGMLFRNTPIEEGNCRVLTNYDILGVGSSLRPRKGFVTSVALDLATANQDYIIHHNNKCLIDDIDNDDAILMEYLLIGIPTADNDGITFDTSKLILRDLQSGVIHEATLSLDNEAGATVNYDSRYSMQAVHDAQILNPSPEGIFSNVEDNAYVVYKDGTENGVGRIRVTLSGGLYEFHLERVTPRALSPHEAVNYGYNMLEEEPYVFENSVSATGRLQLLGVLPYSFGGQLKFNANVGEDITFKLIYKYPSGAGSYKVQWEAQDVEALSGVQVIQDVADSDTITAGDPIEHTFAAPYKQFSVIVKVYDSADTSAPLRSIVLANYYLADNSGTSNKNIGVKNYDLGTATGMADFMHKSVLWGVNGAGNTLFFSDINDPSYFPYPHGIEPMSEYIVKAIPLLDTLLVFTETRIYQLEPDYMTGGFNTKVIQEDLNISMSDAETILVIKNMVYFRSDDQYFMVVPSGNFAGQLQLAPISTQVSSLLYNFSSNVKEIFEEIYAPDVNFDEEWALNLMDNYTYLDGSAVKNIYKYKFTYGGNIRYFEFVLAYDTMLRVWNTYLVETNKNKMLPFRKVVTSDNDYYNLYPRTDGNLGIQFIVRDDLSPKDQINLEGDQVRVLHNYPYLDTGLRKQNNLYKKRYREFVFTVNNMMGVELSFHNEFHLDGIQRTSFFNYHTELIEDPNDPAYGQLVVIKEYQDPDLLPPGFNEATTPIPGKTILGSWKLAYGAFPNLKVVRIRLKISGKGYSGRIKLLAQDESMFQMMDFGWVYRMMNAR